MFRKMIARVLAPVAVLSMAAAACGDSTGPSNDTFGLRTVEGANLPHVVFEAAGYKVEITKGDLKLNENGSFLVTFTMRETEDGEVTTSADTTTGTYTVNGATYTFKFQDEDGQQTLVGQRNGNRIVVKDDTGAEELEYAFEK